MNWQQKLYAVACHLDAVGTKKKLKQSDFVVDQQAIEADHRFGDMLQLMAYTSAEYRDNVGAGEVVHSHRRTTTVIMRGTVRRASGLFFHRNESVWKCKLPDRAVFKNWAKFKTNGANRDTQKFVMFFVAYEGEELSDYTGYPFDEFSTISSADRLCEYLNELGS